MTNSDERPSLKVALATYPGTKALKARAPDFGAFTIDFVEIAPISRAFAPMVRELRFDICEMALVTYLQARDHHKELVLLPVAVAQRFQEGSLLCRTDDATIKSPADLAGKRVGVRAYSQTTGVWLRGILNDDFDVTPDSIRWVTFENAHVAEYSDPPFVSRAAEGQELVAMLKAGELDAIIAGNDRPDDRALCGVFADPDAAGERFRAKHGFVPVNHMVVARRSLIDRRPDLVAGFFEALVRSLVAAKGSRSGLPLGRAALQPAIDLAARYAGEQRLLRRALSPGEIWEGLPRSVIAIAEEGAA